MMKRKTPGKIRYDRELQTEIRRMIEDEKYFHEHQMILLCLGRIIFGKDIYIKLPKKLEETVLDE